MQRRIVGPREQQRPRVRRRGPSQRPDELLPYRDLTAPVARLRWLERSTHQARRTMTGRSPSSLRVSAGHTPTDAITATDPEATVA